MVFRAVMRYLYAVTMAFVLRTLNMRFASMTAAND